MPPKKTANRKKAPKRTTYRKKSTNSKVTILNEATQRISLKGQASHYSSNNETKCVHNIACSPLTQKIKAGANAPLFPDWATQANLYKEYRVLYFSVSAIFDSNKSLANSTVETSSTDITDIDAMMKSPNFKAVSLDGDNKKIFRAYKASSAVERAWLPTAGATAGGDSKAYVKLLQDDLPKAEIDLDPSAPAGERRQKCEIQTTCVVEFKGRLN